MIFPGTRSSRFATRLGDIGKPSSDVRNADGQTFSPVLVLINSEPRIPGMTITGGFPVRILASVKMRSRLGVRCAEMHAAETNVSRATASSPALAKRAVLPSEKEMENKSGLESRKFWSWVFALRPLVGEQISDLNLSP